MSDTLHDAAVIVAEQQAEREGTNLPTAREDSYHAPLRTEGDYQHLERALAKACEELYLVGFCGRLIFPHSFCTCPATDYCIDHHPDSLPCEDGTCPAVIAAWAREKEDK